MLRCHVIGDAYGHLCEHVYMCDHSSIIGQISSKGQYMLISDCIWIWISEHRRFGVGLGWARGRI